MASNTSSVIEGVFAINKPPTLSSAQVIRDAQSAFQRSKLFQPWLDREKQRLQDLSHNQKQKRRSWKSKQPMQVKMGHGGTLDPMATGVLILGVGSGTKSLNTFLECTKSYECVVLFGAATDSYDAVGRVVARKDYSHVTKGIVEKALEQFRGKIMQKPPIFSALKVNGRKMYEYAREGKELPIEIEARPVEVKELEVVEWMEGGEHKFQWPVEEAQSKEKAVVDKALKLEEKGADTGAGAKRKHEEDAERSASPKRARAEPEVELLASGALPENVPIPATDTTDDAPLPVKPTPALPCPAPACRLHMTVTSGFYVRSLAHDLGAAVGSLALMSSLVRTRQGDFELGQNVLPYEDLEKGEEVWGPKVEGMLKEWEQRHGERKDGGVGESGGGKGGSFKTAGHMASKGKKSTGKRSPKKRRRNSSSPDSGGEGVEGMMLGSGLGDDDDCC